MKTKKLTPRNVAPVKRDSAATVSTKATGMVSPNLIDLILPPFAGDDAE